MSAAARFPVVFATGQNPATGERAVWFRSPLGHCR